MRGVNLVARGDKCLTRPVQVSRVGIDDQNALLCFDIASSGIDGDKRDFIRCSSWEGQRRVEFYVERDYDIDTGQVIPDEEV